MLEWVETLAFTDIGDRRILASIYYNAMLYQKGNKGPESLSDLLLVKQPSDNDGTG